MRKPITIIRDGDRYIVRIKLEREHVGHSLLHACRQCRPANMRSFSPAIRRGWVACVAETWKEYRQLYSDVMLQPPSTPIEV